LQTRFQRIDFAVDASRGLFISLTGVLLGFGLLMVHSASITSWPTAFERVYLSRQAIFLLLAVCACYICSFLPPRIWIIGAPYIFFATVVLLILVLIPGIGTEVNGARRWIRLGGVSIQPSELAKLSIPLLMGRLVIGHRDRSRQGFFQTMVVLWPLAAAVPLVFFEPDLGTSLFLIVMGILVLWIAGWPKRNFAFCLGMGIPAACFLFSIRSYQFERIRGFFLGWQDVDHAPYQIRQSLMSLSEGGLQGVGLGKGWQKLSYLPEAHTDFVLSVVGEELGLLGTLCLVVVWSGFFWAGYRIIRRRPRSSYQYIVGLALLASLVLQAAMNTAVVTAMVPPKGISHPFLSYGGSNLLVSLVAVGIILSLTSTSSDGGGLVAIEPKVQ
jgi:cell division protein FtsW